MFDRIGNWWRRNAPTRESLEEVRWLRPFAHRVLEPSLWRFTRRSVPRGVALGLIVGIFLMIPGLQIIGAALLALPCRANVPIAVAMTFLSNPATTPFILYLSIIVGNRFVHSTADIGTVAAMIELIKEDLGLLGIHHDLFASEAALASAPRCSWSPTGHG